MNNRINKEQKADRDRRIIAMRLGGVTFANIAHSLEVSIGLAHKVVKQHLADTIRETALDVENLRVQEASRLDQLQAGAWKNAVQGNVASGRLVLSIMERRARMLGLDVQSEDTASGQKAAMNAAVAAGAAAAAAVHAVNADGMTAVEAVEAYRKLAQAPAPVHEG